MMQELGEWFAWIQHTASIIGASMTKKKQAGGKIHLINISSVVWCVCFRLYFLRLLAYFEFRFEHIIDENKLPFLPSKYLHGKQMNVRLCRRRSLSPGTSAGFYFAYSTRPIYLAERLGNVLDPAMCPSSSLTFPYHTHTHNQCTMHIRCEYVYDRPFHITCSQRWWGKGRRARRPKRSRTHRMVDALHNLSAVWCRAVTSLSIICPR